MRAFAFAAAVSLVVAARILRNDLTFAQIVHLFTAVAIVVIAACLLVVSCY